MARLADIERIAIVGLIIPETAELATRLATGFRPSWFTDSHCRVAFSAIAAVKRTETDGRPNCGRRYGDSWRACGILQPVVVVEDVWAECGVRFRDWIERPLEQWEIDEAPEWVHEGVKAGTPVREENGFRDTSTRTEYNAVDHMIIFGPEITEKNLTNAFKTIRQQAARRGAGARA